MLRSLTVAALITLCGGLLAIAQTDVSGSWTLTITSVQGSSDTPMVLEQEGDMLEGTIGAGGAVAESRVEGTITGNDIRLTSEIDTAEVGPLTLRFAGTVDGSNMKGTVDFGGLASGSWTAVKN